jgi:hypothetical protein
MYALFSPSLRPAWAIDFEAYCHVERSLAQTKACLSDIEWEDCPRTLHRFRLNASTLQQFDVLNATGEHVEAPDA